jgi:hypothetical protein
LSQSLRLNSSQIKPWLERETTHILTPVHAQAKKLRDELQLSIERLVEASRLLLDNSDKEIEKKNMKVYNRARALNKLSKLFLERLKKLNAPENVSYQSLSTFASEVQSTFIVIDVDVRNWFPRISPFFIFDRRRFLSVYEKLKETLDIVNTFLKKEYIKTKTLEETFLLIDELQALEKLLSEVQSQESLLKSEHNTLDAEIAIMAAKINEIKTKGTIDKLCTADAESASLDQELKIALRHLQKPFIKMQALATQGGAGLTPDELRMLHMYLETPFMALVSEAYGYPTLKELVSKLARLIDEDKLKLKPDKARKAKQFIQEVLQRDSLSSLQQRCKAVAELKRAIADSAEMRESQQRIAEYTEQINKLKVRKASVEANESVKVNLEAELLEKIRHRKKTIESNISSFLGRTVEIT